MFLPSKTAQNGLNFVTKDEETNLAVKEQPEEILNLFKLIYIILNEDYSSLESNTLIQNLVQNIYPKLNVENLSMFFLTPESLFLNYISKNTILTDDQYNQMTGLLQNYPKLLSSSDLMKINRCVSYLTFILKEFNDYATAKLSDGTPACQVRKAKNSVEPIKKQIENLKGYLH